MPGYHGVLRDGDELAAAPYFDGDWRSFRKTSFEQDTSLTFTAAGEEYSIFVLDGTGSFDVGGTTHGYHAGTSLTVALGSTLELRATTRTVVFVTTLDVDS